MSVDLYPLMPKNLASKYRKTTNTKNGSTFIKDWEALFAHLNKVDLSLTRNMLEDTDISLEKECCLIVGQHFKLE